MTNSEKIFVTKTFLPPEEEYEEYLKIIWQDSQLTNKGPLHKKFEDKLTDYLGVDCCHFVTNGTLALQLALRALNITSGEVITTPFSYVATTSAILWERCRPVYVDINPETLCIDPNKIEAAITEKTKAILPVHVFGNPCDIEKIEGIAQKHKLKVIYDGAHAFGVKYKGRPLLDYGDISICSFHSTKPFHTIEGGGVFVKDKKLSEKVELMRRFGHHGDVHHIIGINAKASEFQAAMGLCNLKYFKSNTESRRRVTEAYDSQLQGKIRKVKIRKDTEYNYSYYPVIFETEEKLQEAKRRLEEENIFPRRYFYPSLNTLPYIKTEQSCPISEDISVRILCLPLYEDLEESVISKICEEIKK